MSLETFCAKGAVTGVFFRYLKWNNLGADPLSPY